MVRLPRLPTPGVRPIEPPRYEGLAKVRGGRVLSYAEYGDPDGELVLWHHGTPGARRQMPLIGRRAAERLGLRVVVADRPGVGESTNHRYASVSEWATDALLLVDQLGHDRFASVGLSGGGPYALSLAAAAPDRVDVVALLGSVCPIAGADAVPGTSIVTLAAHFRHLIEPFRTVSGVGLWLAVQPVLPVAHYAYRLYSSRMPEGDRKVFADPDIEAMFVDDIVVASRRRFGAVFHDIALFGRPWGFELSDIHTPVLWWHGDSDNIVPLTDAEHAGELLVACEMEVREAESHLGAFAVADVVLESIVANRASNPGDDLAVERHEHGVGMLGPAAER